MAKLIEAKWGLIEEGSRDQVESNALVCIDPGKTKRGERHDHTVETFTHVYGYGVILAGDEAKELIPGKTITVNPGEAYSIFNLGEQTDPLCFWVNAKPPYNPEDEHLVSELIKPTTVMVGGRVLGAIQWLDSEPVNGGIHSKDGYDIEVARAGDEEIGFYRLPPYCKARVVKITGEVRCTERLIQGRGWFIKYSPDGKVEVRELDAFTGNTEDIHYGKGDVVVWGAFGDETRIVTTSDVPFTGDMEVPIEIGSPELPDIFWQELARLTN